MPVLQLLNIHYVGWCHIPSGISQLLLGSWGCSGAGGLNPRSGGPCVLPGVEGNGFGIRSEDHNRDSGLNTDRSRGIAVSRSFVS